MDIIYNGNSAEVEIAATGQVATAGEAIDVPDDVAKSLLEQSIWTAKDKKVSK